jgi:hypothetical protein
MTSPKPTSDATPGSGTVSDPNAAAQQGDTTKPTAAADPGDASMPGNTAKPDDTAKPGDTAKPAAAATPGNAAEAGTAGDKHPRRIRPIRAARSVGRTAVDWSRRPSGRLILPATLAALLVAAAGTAGAYLVPEALNGMPASTVAPPQMAGNGSGAPTPSGVLPPLPPLPTETFSPVSPAPVGATGAVASGARPADALAGWADQVGTRVGVPVVAVQAYGYAELVLTRTKPGCHLSWTTLAAIAKVESAHGSANGAVLGVDGQAMPAIIGLPLDGKGGRQLIQDTDGGALDTDRTFDRAMGPLQFIPTTWRENAVDADNNGVTDPHDIDDASLAAGNYLCRDGRDMAKPEDWWEAILSYNDVRPYAQKVFTEANAYGLRSRT